MGQREYKEMIKVKSVGSRTNPKLRVHFYCIVLYYNLMVGLLRYIHLEVITRSRMFDWFMHEETPN